VRFYISILPLFFENVNYFVAIIRFILKILLSSVLNGNYLLTALSF